MDEKNFKKLLDEALEPIKQQLENPETGLKRISEKLDANTESVITIEKEVKSYADSYKENQRNIKRLDTRLNVVEEELSIEPPEEQKIPHFV